MKVKFTNSDEFLKIIKRCASVVAVAITLMPFNTELNAQSLGLNQPTPDASSIIDAVATDRGVLIPRVALTATNAVGPIAAPADALLVYNTATAGGAGVNVTPGFYYYNVATTAWIRLFSGGGSPGVRWDQIVDPGAGLTLSHGTNATIFNFANVATTGFAMNATALTTGKLLSLTSSNAAATGNLFHVSSNSIGALAAGGVLFDFSANHTGVGFEIDDVTTAGSVMKMNANSLVGGIGLDIVSTATGLTGRLQSIQLTGDNAGNTNASNLLYIGSSGASSVSKGLTVDLASTGNLVAGGVLFNFANHTGTGFSLVDVTTAGTAMSLTANALAGGTGLSIASSSTGNNMTGNLASITLSGNNVGNTGDLLELNTSGALSIAKALNVQVASTGNFSTTGAVAFNFSAAHTGSAFRIDDATLTGKVVDIVGSALTTGRLLDVATSGNTWLGNGTTDALATISSSSTAGTAAGSSVLLKLERTGANTNNPHTTYGLYSTITKTNATAGTNTAGYFTASGTAAVTTNYGVYSSLTGAGASNIAGFFEATTAGTNNYAIQVPTNGGRIKMGDGTLIDMSAVTTAVNATAGIILPQTTNNTACITAGQMQWDTDHNVLTVGTGAKARNIGIPNGMQVFTNATHPAAAPVAWAVPVGITTLWIKCWGAGGGGGGSNNNDGGSGGGGGGYCEMIIDVSGIANLTVGVGLGGAGGVGNADGTVGTNTTVVVGGTTLTANGGAFGDQDIQASYPGGTALNGTINIPGAASCAGEGSDGGGGGAGGGSPFGGAGGSGGQGANAADPATSGAPGTFPGGGGGGASEDNASAVNGGAGANGYVIIYW